MKLKAFIGLLFWVVVLSLSNLCFAGSLGQGLGWQFGSITISTYNEVASVATIDTGNGAQEVYGQDTFSWSVMLDSATTNYLGALQVVMPSFAHAITISSVTFCCNSGTVDGVTQIQGNTNDKIREVM